MRLDPNDPCANCGQPLNHPHADPWCDAQCYRDYRLANVLLTRMLHRSQRRMHRKAPFSIYDRPLIGRITRASNYDR